MGEHEGGTRSRLRKLGKAAIAAALALGLLWAGAAALLHTLLDPESLARRVEPRLEAALSRDVELGGVGLSLFPGLGVELREVSVSSPEGMEAPDLASVDRIRLGIALLPLLRGRVRVDEATAESLDLRLVVADDGRSNFGDFVPEGGEPGGGAEGGSPLSLEIRDVRLERGAVSYRDRRTGRRVAAESVSGRAALERTAEGWDVEGRVRVGALRGRVHPAVRRWSGTEAGLELTARAGPEFRWIDVASGTARLGPVELSLSGRVDSLRSSERLLDLRARAEGVPVEDAVALVDSGGTADRTSGTIGLDLEISGRLGPDARPTATGLVTLRGGGYRDAGGTVLAEDLEAEAALGPDSLVVRRLTGRLLGGPVRGDGALRLSGGRPFAGRIRASPRLDRWSAAAADSLDASGALAVDVTVRGRPGTPSATRVRGTVAPESVRLRREGWRAPVGVPSGSIRLEGDGASTTDLPVTLGGDTLRVSGTVRGLFSRLDSAGLRPEVDAGVRARRLDLGALFPRDAEGGPGYGRLAFAHLGGRSLGGRTPAEIAAARRLSRPGAPPVAGRIRLGADELLYGRWRLSGVEARLTLRPDRVEVDEFAFAVLGGRAAGSLSLGVGPDPLQPFSFRLEMDGVAGRELLSRVTPLGGLLSGTTALRLTLAGTLDTLMLPAARGLDGEGRLAVRDGRLHENPVTAAAARSLSLPALRSPGFRRFVVPFRVRGDSLRLPSSILEADSLSVRLAGVVGLGGRLDLTAGLEIPRKVLSGLPVPGGAAGDAFRRLVGAGQGSGGLSLGIRGTVARPRVAVRVAPPPVSAPGGVEKTLEKGARGLFDRVFGGARGDSARADTVRRDSARSSGGG